MELQTFNYLNGHYRKNVSFLQTTVKCFPCNQRSCSLSKCYSKRLSLRNFLKVT